MSLQQLLFYSDYVAQSAPAIGQVLFDVPGTYSWTAPEGVTSVCVVCIGAGGSPAGSNSGGSGAGGGGLGWKNNVSVTPGNSYDVVVGAGGPDVTTGTATAGGNSYFINTSVCAGFGGGGASAASDTIGIGGGYVGDGGGNGGNGGTRGGSAGDCGGGGGAGGYLGNGGDGGSISGGSPLTSNAAASGSGGGGGGAAGGSGDTGGPGGGVGVWGLGNDGGSRPGSTTDGLCGRYGSYAPDIGYAHIGSNPYSTTTPSRPGSYGGGGSGADSSNGERVSSNGAVRIIWGPGRYFPSTNTFDVSTHANTAPNQANLVSQWEMDMGIVKPELWVDVKNNYELRKLNNVTNSASFANSLPNNSRFAYSFGPSSGLENSHFTGAAIPAGASPRTMYMLAKYTAGAFQGVLYGAATTSNAFGITLSNSEGFYTADFWADNNTGSTPFIDNVWRVYSLAYDGTTYWGYADNVQQVTATKTLNTTLEKICVNETLAYGDRVGGMDLAAILLYNKSHSDSERVDVINYLTTKYL